MTICIAALAENGSKAFLMTDRMITTFTPVQCEFEPKDESIKKIYSINDNVHVLVAGNSLSAHDLIKQVKAKLLLTENPQAIPKDSSETNKEHPIQEIFREQYVVLRQKILTQNFLEPIGINSLNYQLINMLPQIMCAEISQKIMQFNINIDLIIVMRDNDKNFRIFTLVHPGVLTEYSMIGHACAGGGSAYASFSLITSDYKKSSSIAEVEKLVTEAKRKAQSYPGVGIQDSYLKL